ncbi:MAG: PQQ-binding-like beta-propeller repeat protein, partial [Phycisphaerae bacterium]
MGSIYRWWSNRWIITRGLATLGSSNLTTDRQRAVRHWVKETQSRWPDPPTSLVQALYANEPAHQPAVRTMLATLTGADYIDNEEGWHRWFEDWQSRADGKSPRTPWAEQIRLRKEWEAPIGRTAAFSPIIVLDGSIFIGSFGRGLGVSADDADGLVIVDGENGKTALISAPFPGLSGSDVIGIAAGDKTIFTASPNGVLAAYEPEGAVKWVARTGEAIVSTPLSIDINRDNIADVVCADRQGSIFATNGENGAILWRQKPARNADLPLNGITFAATRDVIWVADSAGFVRKLRAKDGNVLCSGTIPGRAITELIIGPASGASTLFVGTHQGEFLRLVERNGSLDAIPFAARYDAIRGAAPLRTILGSAGAEMKIVGSASMDRLENRTTVLAATVTGPAWQIRLDGVTSAPPAIADINRDGNQVLVFATTNTSEDGNTTGHVFFVSSAGHILAQL